MRRLERDAKIGETERTSALPPTALICEIAELPCRVQLPLWRCMMTTTELNNLHKALGLGPTLSGLHRHSTTREHDNYPSSFHSPQGASCGVFHRSRWPSVGDGGCFTQSRSLQHVSKKLFPIFWREADIYRERRHR